MRKRVKGERVRERGRSQPLQCRTRARISTNESLKHPPNELHSAGQLATRAKLTSSPCSLGAGRAGSQCMLYEGGMRRPRQDRAGRISVSERLTSASFSQKGVLITSRELWAGPFWISTACYFSSNHSLDFISSPFLQKKNHCSGGPEMTKEERRFILLLCGSEPETGLSCQGKIQHPLGISSAMCSKGLDDGWFDSGAIQVLKAL